MISNLNRVAKASDLSRQNLSLQDDVRFVPAAEYLRLLVSSCKMERSDIPDARVRGLKDLNSGIRYLVPEEQLF